MPVIIKSDPRAREKPCLRCGYSLRKLDATHCPECGLSVWLSLNQNVTLEWSNPAWLRQVVRGLWVMAGAQVLGLIAYGLAMAVVLPGLLYQHRVERAIHAASAGGAEVDRATIRAAIAAVPRPDTPGPALVPTAILLGAAYLVAYNGGLLLLVRNERRYPDRMATPRTFAWVISGFSGLMALAMVAWAVSPTTMMLFQYGVKLAVIAGALVTWAYLRLLARRLPHATLARICAWLMLVPALSLLKVVPFCAIYVVSQFAWLVDFLPPVYLPVSFVLFAWFARMLARAAASAEQSWASETASGATAAP